MLLRHPRPDVDADFDAPAPSDEPLDVLLTSGQAAALLGISRPTLVAWLEAGRIPLQWRGSHRRPRSSDVLAYLDGLSILSDHPGEGVHGGSC